MPKVPLENELTELSVAGGSSPLDLVGSIQFLPQPTLESLPTQEFCVTLETHAEFLLQTFEGNAQLPGAIVLEDNRIVGVISRQTFLLQMSQPYSIELYLGRPIRRFWEMYAGDILELPSCCHIDAAIHHALERPHRSLQEPIVVRHSDGSYKLLGVHLLLLAQAELLRQTQKLQQKTEMALRQANKKLKVQATRDGLTGVANRRKFESELKREWQRLQRERQPLSLILCDVDHFKKYNDTYGHQAGDKCLSYVAAALQRAVKRPADLVARYGGEEFAVLLSDTSLAGAERIAGDLRRAVENLGIPHAGSPIGTGVTISLGVCTLVPSPQSSVEALLRKADEALYNAKNAGRNRAIAIGSTAPCAEEARRPGEGA